MSDVLAEMEDEYGTDFVFGERDPAEVASDWELTGLSPGEVRQWIHAGAFDPISAAALDRHGLRPADCKHGGDKSIAALASAGSMDAEDAVLAASKRGRFVEPVPGGGIDALPWDLADLVDAVVAAFKKLDLKPGALRVELQAFGPWTRLASIGAWYFPVSMFIPSASPLVVARSYVWGNGTRTKPPTEAMPWCPQESDSTNWLGLGEPEELLHATASIQCVPAAWLVALHQLGEPHDIGRLLAVAKAIESIAREPASNSRLLQL